MTKNKFIYSAFKESFDVGFAIITVCYIALIFSSTIIYSLAPDGVLPFELFKVYLIKQLYHFFPWFGGFAIIIASLLFVINMFSINQLSKPSLDINDTK